MKPTIGRIVHYFPTPRQLSEWGGNQSSPLPAVVVKVWSDTCVNLKVLNDGPSDHWVTSALNDEAMSPGWDWPKRED